MKSPQAIATSATRRRRDWPHRRCPGGDDREARLRRQLSGARGGQGDLCAAGAAGRAGSGAHYGRQTSAATRRLKWTRLSRRLPNASRRAARTLACAADATISTPDTRPACFKKAILRETLERAGVTAPDEIAVLAARAMGSIAIASAWRSMRTGIRAIAARRSHAIVPIRECPIAAPLLVRGCAGCRRNPGARSAESASARSAALLRCGRNRRCWPRSLLTEPAQASPGDIAAALRERIPATQGRGACIGRPRRAIRRARWRSGAQPSLIYRAAGFDYRVDHGAFFQVNRWLIDAIGANVVRAATRASSPGTCLPAWASSRASSRQHFDRVVAVESAPASTAALAANLAAPTATARASIDPRFSARRARRARGPTSLLSIRRAPGWARRSTRLLT